MLLRKIDKLLFRSLTRITRGITSPSLSETSNIDDDDHFADPGAPRVAITKDRNTIVLYHPQEKVKYEDTIPIPRDDPKYSAHENLESLVREKLDNLDIADKALDKPNIQNPWPMRNKETIPVMMHLSNLFYTSKHLWWPKRKDSRPPIEPDRPRE
ncbi:large ribosomal subunit protein mL42-like [Styela clava]